MLSHFSDTFRRNKKQGPSMSRPELSVVILSFNRIEELKVNIPVIFEFSREMGWEVIVVDNGSSDGSVEFLRAVVSGLDYVHLVTNHENLGVAGGRNVGWAKAAGCLILNIDDDAFVDLDDIRAMLEFMERNPSIGIMSPRIVHRQSLAPQCDHGSAPVRISNFHGACHLLRREVYSVVGEIDPSCSFGGEELDYSLRARNAGFDVYYAPVATAVHNNHQRAGDEGLWRRRQWVFNYTRVLSKNFPFFMALLFSARLLASQLFSALKLFGVLSSLSLVFSYFSGLISGFRRRSVVSRSVLDLYRNPSLRPDFGNVPLLEKILRN
ncbi:MAG TPA: glycosyltransferase [Thermomonas sp.]